MCLRRDDFGESISHPMYDPSPKTVSLNFVIRSKAIPSQRSKNAGKIGICFFEPSVAGAEMRVKMTRDGPCKGPSGGGASVLG